MSGSQSACSIVPLSSLTNSTSLAETDTLIVLVADPTTKQFVPMQLSRAALSTVLAKSGALAPLDANGHLVLGDVAVWGVDANGHLVCPATIPDTNDTPPFVPVPGSNVIYTDGGILKRA